MSWDTQLDEQLLRDLYIWIDQIPLSRVKKRIEKDFSDGVMVAELIKFYFPSWVDLHNYAPANNTQQKMANWNLLTKKVFPRFYFYVPETVMRGIALGRPGLIEVFLYNLRAKIDDCLYEMRTNPTDPKYRSINQKSKTSEINGITSRTNRQYSSSVGDLTSNQNDFASKHSHYPSTRAKYYQEDSPMKGRNLNGHETRNSNLTNNPDDMMIRLQYDEKEQECLAKEEQIRILEAKVRRLEHLLHLKDIRVEDLSVRLDQNSYLPPIHGTTSTRQRPFPMSISRRQ